MSFINFFQYLYLKKKLYIFYNFKNTFSLILNLIYKILFLPIFYIIYNRLYHLRYFLFNTNYEYRAIQVCYKYVGDTYENLRKLIIHKSSNYQKEDEFSFYFSDDYLEDEFDDIDLIDDCIDEEEET